MQLHCDSSNQSHRTTSNTNTRTGSGYYHDKLHVQVDVTSTSSSAATAAASLSSSVYGEGSSDALRMHQQNIPQNNPQVLVQVEEHSLTNVKTRESKRKLSAVQSSSTATQDNASSHNNRNCKKKTIDDKSKEKEKEKGKEREKEKEKEGECMKNSTTATSIGDKPAHSKAKMRLNDNVTTAATATAAATSHTDVTKKSISSIQNKRNGAVKYTEVTSEKVVGEKDKEKGGGRGGRGEKGVSRDHLADTVTEINTNTNTNSNVNVKSELDTKIGGVPGPTLGGIGVGTGVIETRRHSKRERSDTKHTQQLQQQQLQLQQQMIVCGGDAESSFLSQEDSNTTVETASQGSCDWCVRTYTLYLSHTHTHTHTLYLSQLHNLALLLLSMILTVCVSNFMIHHLRRLVYVLTISSYSYLCTV